MSRVQAVPFEGDWPNIAPGDAVTCRTPNDDWVAKVARSHPRYDTCCAVGGKCFLTIAVSTPDDLEWVNWPAEDVRLAPTPEGTQP